MEGNGFFWGWRRGITVGKAACRGQGARRLQPRGQGSEAMLRAEETGLREDLGSHFCKPQAGAHPGKVGKGEETEEGGWLWLCPRRPRDHLGLPHPFSKASSPKGLAVPHPSSWFPGQWLCWLVPHVYKEPTHGRKGLPIFSFASTPPCIAHATPPLP